MPSTTPETTSVSTVRIADIAAALTDAMKAEATAKATVARLRTAMTAYGLKAAAASGAAPRWDVPHLCTLGIEQWAPTSTPVVTLPADLVRHLDKREEEGFSNVTVSLPTERVAELDRLVTAAHYVEMDRAELYMICSVLSDFGDIDESVIGQVRNLVEAAIGFGPGASFTVDARNLALTAAGAAWCEEHLTVTQVDGVEVVRVVDIDETTGESKIVDMHVTTQDGQKIVLSDPLPGTTVGHNSPRLVVRLDKSVTAELKSGALKGSDDVLRAAGLDTDAY